MVTLRHTIMALLTLVRAGADKVLCQGMVRAGGEVEDSALALIAPPQVPPPPSTSPPLTPSSAASSSSSSLFLCYFSSHLSSLIMYILLGALSTRASL